MDNSIRDILTGFVDERLDSTMELLRDTDKEYLSLTKRLTSILEKMDILYVQNLISNQTKNLLFSETIIQFAG